jgi:hypothetical protein
MGRRRVFRDFPADHDPVAAGVRFIFGINHDLVTANTLLKLPILDRNRIAGNAVGRTWPYFGLFRPLRCFSGREATWYPAANFSLAGKRGDSINTVATCR